MQEREVVAAEVVRHAAVEVRASEPGGVTLPVGVPGVALPVSVVVAEVVGLPGHRRQDDGDAMLPERRGRTTNGAKPARPSAAEQPCEVEAARPVAYPYVDHGTSAGGADYCLSGHGNALHLAVAESESALGRAEDAKTYGLCGVEGDEGCVVARRVTL